MSRLLSPIAAAVLVIAACGGGRGHGKTSGAVAPKASSATPILRQGPPSTGPEAQRLASALLAVPDLPGGWRLGQDTRSTPEDTNLCGANLATIERQGQKLAEVGVSFQQSPSGPYLSQTLTAYSGGLAQQVLDALRAAAGSCNTVTVKDKQEGSFSNWELTTPPFPQLGDQTLALREYLPAGNVEAIIVYVRRGDLLSVLLHVSVGQPIDRTQTEAFARRADEKLAQVVGGH